MGEFRWQIFIVFLSLSLRIPASRIRLITVELCIKLLCQLVEDDNNVYVLTETQHNAILAARAQSMIVLRNFYKSEDIFLDLFEDEYNKLCKSTLNVEFLCMDSTILLPPTGTPLTGIGFTRRLPCGEEEKARRAIRVYFFLRKLCQTIVYEAETLLPLSNQINCYQVDNVLDLSKRDFWMSKPWGRIIQIQFHLDNSDLIACTVLSKDGTKYRRFLVIESLQLILVEPDSKRLGWGIAKLVGFLQDVEVTGDKEDSRCLRITIHRGGAATNSSPILSAKFIFDDHIRCMAAKQRLTKGRTKARQKKMTQIAQLLEISGQQLKELASPSVLYAANSLRANAAASSSSAKQPREHRPLFSTANRVPGFAAALRRESMPSGSVSRVQMAHNRSIDGWVAWNRASATPWTQFYFDFSISANAPATIVAPSPETRPGIERMAIQKYVRESPVHVRPGHGKSLDHVQRARTFAKWKFTKFAVIHCSSEEIPLEDFRQSRNSSPSSRCSSRATSRSHTPSRLVAETLSITPQENQLAVPCLAAVETEPNPSTSNSKETSFIAQKKKGTVETVWQKDGGGNGSGRWRKLD